MAFQGGFTLRYGIQQFKEYLASPGTEFTSVASVALEFLNLLAASHAQVKAFAELLSHIVEGALRHPSANAEWFLAEVAEFTTQLLVSSVGPASPYPPLETLRKARFRVFRNILSQAVQTGLELTQQPGRRRAVKLDVLKCTVTPHLVFDGNIPEHESSVLGLAEPTQSAEIAEGQTSTAQI